MSCHVARGGRQQEGDRPGDFARFADAAEGHASFEFADERRVRAYCGRGKGARADGVDADAEAGEMVRNKLQDFGRDLTGKDAIIFHERMLSEDPRTLQNLGDELGVSRERVRQLEKRLQGKLKDFLAAELDESVLHP